MSSDPEQTESHSLIDALYRISSLVNQTEDPHEALNIILDEVVNQLDATSASISLIDPDTSELRIETYQGLPNDTEDFRLPLGHGITGWVALHGKPLLVGDISKEQRYIAVKDSIQSEMAVPMKIESMFNVEDSTNLTIGVVNVDSETLNAFTEQDLKLLTLLTNEATRVVNRLWFINHLKQKAQYLESVITIGQKLVKKLKLQEVLDTIAQETQYLMEHKMCAIFLFDNSKKKLQLHSLADANGKINYEEILDPEDTSIGVALRRNKQVSIFDIRKTEEHHLVSLIHERGLVSLLSTPIEFGNETIGILNVYTSKPHRFNNDERKIFSILATLGAVAIQNSLLYSKVFASEESLRRNERLTTLGLLAAEIAHEIRNPLTVIKLLFDTLELDFAESDARHQDTQIIKEKINHLEEIVGNVLSFGKSNTELHAKWPLNGLVEETLRLVRLKLEQEKVELNFNPHNEQVYVEAFKGQIQQVLLNLIINAEQAMPDGGKIDVNITIEEKSGIRFGNIQVSDTGTGVPQNIRENIFDSFLTSKRDGTGLGLSISKRIMKQHRGNLNLVDSDSNGTTFEFCLPLH